MVLTEEQVSIQRTARGFARERLPVAHLRALRDSEDPVGFSRAIWRELAELGLVGIALPEADGGGGLGFAELGVVLEELGRTLAPTPFFSTILLGAGAISIGGSAAQRGAFLPAIAAGERIVTLAHEEGTRHARHRIATRAERTAEGFALRGEKVMVPDGHVADALVVVARTSGNEGDREGLTLFLVPRESAGLGITRVKTVDGRDPSRVRLEGVKVGEEAVIGVIDRGAEVIDAVLDRATIGLSAEMLGGAEEAFERTVAYLKERRQFGVPIGSFQALKHRAAQMFCELELSRSIVWEALRAVDAGRGDVPVLASAAKAKVTDTFLLVANEAIQMHGGVGVTDELDIGFFLKRARVAEMTLGGAAWHRDRFARLQGY